MCPFEEPDANLTGSAAHSIIPGIQSRPEGRMDREALCILQITDALQEIGVVIKVSDLAAIASGAAPNESKIEEQT